MWRDILIVLGFVFAGLTYFGLTPRRLSAHAGTAKAEMTHRSRRQKAYLYLMIALTLVYAFFAVWKFEVFRTADLLLGIAVFTAGWCCVLEDVWKLSKRGEKVVDIVIYSVIVPLLIAAVILSDLALWQKLAYPLGGVCLGIIVGVLGTRRTKRWEDTHLSGRGDV
jgi:hypothetical protein